MVRVDVVLKDDRHFDGECSLESLKGDITDFVLKFGMEIREINIVIGNVYMAAVVRNSPGNDLLLSDIGVYMRYEDRELQIAEYEKTLYAFTQSFEIGRYPWETTARDPEIKDENS